MHTPPDQTPYNAIAVILHKRFSDIARNRADRRNRCYEYQRLLENCADYLGGAVMPRASKKSERQ
jgi:hypothetical protein